MKKSLSLITILALCISTSFISCKNNTEKEADATQKVTEAKEELKDTEEATQKDVVAKANDAQWQTYKKEALTTITKNEVRIVELEKAKQKPGNRFDGNYKQSIEKLKASNTDLKTRITNYENNQTDWNSFKRDFGADLDKLGKDLNDFSVKNKL
jgi:uncharacterized protein YxeA